MIYQPMETKPFDPANHLVPYSEVRKRLMGAAPAVKRAKVAPKPAPKIVYVNLFSEHVSDWRRYLAQVNMNARDYIKFRCEELGVSYMDIIGPSRFDEHVRPRQMLMWELKQTRPGMSLSQIGKEFGGRDHSTLIHGMRMHEKRLAAK